MSTKKLRFENDFSLWLFFFFFKGLDLDLDLDFSLGYWIILIILFLSNFLLKEPKNNVSRAPKIMSVGAN
jgi:hypothetical protein